MDISEVERLAKVSNFAQLAEEKASIVIPASSYQVDNDSRILVPFIKNHKFGFLNKQGVEIVSAKYEGYLDDCYSKDDLIRVLLRIYEYKNDSNGNRVQTTYCKYGVINYKGEVILPFEYDEIGRTIPQTDLIFVIRKNYKYGVINTNGQVIVPLGKYQYIDWFDQGLARVKNVKWGIIDIKGNEVLPLEYDNIWNFYNKGRSSTRAEKENTHSTIYFSELT